MKVSFKDHLFNSIEQYAESAGWDLAIIRQQISSAFQDLLDNYRQLAAQKEREEKQRAFDIEFEKRQLEYVNAVKNCEYVFELRRQWKSSKKDLVVVDDISRSIFESEKGATNNG
jgi:uncharacterized LabA/DUF88 family protein